MVNAGSPYYGPVLDLTYQEARTAISYHALSSYSPSMRRTARRSSRFTDDLGAHWQVDNDLHLELLASRDW